ncbi:MAG: hypothetical protein H6895_11015 [Defluviimonas sp.]|uniref:hypothetical protein n=1 Tax=Albidovulum sp. TaxID=1872424 RepID=UPI001D2FE7BA|nr:hypothetical protein [Paracoccaceae bacterium]MCC0064601.1 hypothetical protein [Defluviimonas sp.]
MIATSAAHPHTEKAGVLRGVLWIAAAVLACLSVFLINGRPLFYYDTVGYIIQGNTALTHLGVPGESPLAERAELVTEARMKGVPAAMPDTTEINADRTVDGSRSAVYALIAGVFAHLGALEGLIALNVVAVLVAVWLPMRVAMRRLGLPMSLPKAVSLPIIVAGFGSLPFFVAYLMPDTFSPVMILVFATLAVFARQMRPWEILLALALGSLAIMSHLSHLAIAVVMIPAVALVSAALQRRRWWIAPALTLLIVGIGFSEQSALRTAAKSMADSEVVIKPYITARLIEDGPGYAYLKGHCPNEAIPTCKLYEALSHSGDPWRLTATHIVFETSQRLGSFRLMTPEDQRLVADNQIVFFFRVFRDRPLSVIHAFIRNTLLQARWVSVEMTIPDEEIIWQNSEVTGLLTGDFQHGRITRDTSWLRVVTPAQEIFYGLCLLITLGLVLAPRRVPGEIRALAVVVLFGILANALVCGGISQPATRYGARVIWLLPLVTTILVLFAWRSRQFAPQPGRRP